MFKRSSLQSYMIWSLCGALLAGFLVLMVLLAMGGTNSSSIGIGSIELLQISRTPIGTGGSMVELAFNGNLTWYFLAWIIVGGVIAYVLWGSRQSKDKAPTDTNR